VYGQKSSDGSTVLQVVGRGDPTLNRDSLNALAQQLQQQDIHHIHQLVAVDSYFAGSPVHPNWEWEDVQSGYGAPANSLILDFNAVELTLWPQAVGEPLQVVWDNPAMTNQWQVINRSRTAAAGTANSATVGRDLSRPVLHVSGQLAVDDEPDAFAVAVPNPAEHFVQQFQAVLNQHDIEVEQTSVTSQPVAPLPMELATLRSPPLSELLVAVNRDSDNLYAEVLLKTLGQLYEPQLPQPQDAQAPVPDASEAGSQVAIAILEQLGVDPTEVVMVDGSGLSRHNLVTPHAIVDTLQAMADHAHGDIYRQSLAVAGTSGTLRYRFRETPVEGRLYGKTGTLTGNVTLSGYLNPPQYDPLVFSIMVNNSSQRTRQSRQLIDQMVQVLIQLTHC
jgi:D-alanyl-D-alanine carboxypeptidase/D-alanyl-D-alanine-endopeptidase (penicillin-binding protein 4)